MPANAHLDAVVIECGAAQVSFGVPLHVDGGVLELAMSDFFGAVRLGFVGS